MNCVASNVRAIDLPAVQGLGPTPEAAENLNLMRQISKGPVIRAHGRAHKDVLSAEH
jgi:hypothetical protein